MVNQLEHEELQDCRRETSLPRRRRKTPPPPCCRSVSLCCLPRGDLDFLGYCPLVKGPASRLEAIMAAPPSLPSSAPSGSWRPAGTCCG